MKKQKQITGVFINVETQKITKIVIDDNLDTFQEMIRCDCVQGVNRKFSNNKRYDVYCDDWGANKRDRKPAILMLCDNEIVETIYGNCLIFKHDKEGNTISIPDKEIKELQKGIAVLYGTYNVLITLP